MYNYSSEKYKDYSLPQLIEMNKELMITLKCVKNKIDHQKYWDIAKKCANEFEFIFSFNNDCVADKTPISRSYFKMIEILYDNQIINDLKKYTTNSHQTLTLSCICEGPGGFIQALDEVCSMNNISFQPIKCITLISNDKKVPNWKLNDLFNYTISYGQDGSGDIYKTVNIDFFINSVGLNTSYIVTADGGFDFSNDFNSQEINFSLLLLCEVYIALNIQKHQGHFVIKVFDLFHIDTINIISILRVFYREIIIQKPKTSRPANSEKYLICKGFVQSNKYTGLLKEMKKCIQNKSLNNLSSLVLVNHLHDTLKYIHFYNTHFVTSQINYINKTLDIIKSNVFDRKSYIKSCVQWCKKYNINIKEEYDNEEHTTNTCLAEPNSFKILGFFPM